MSDNRIFVEAACRIDAAGAAPPTAEKTTEEELARNTLAIAIALGMAISAGAHAQEAPRPWESLRPTAPLPPVGKTGRLKVDGAEIRYAIYGEGRPVILLHPALGHGDYWANQIGPLSQDFQIIVVDLRGHGRSTGAGKPLSYVLRAEDVVRLIKTLKLKDAAVVGWGDGAVVGLEIALRYPKRISQLVAFGLTYDKAGLQAAPDQTATFNSYVMKALADYQSMAPDPAGFAGMLEQMEALWEREPVHTAAELARIDVPTTVIAAEHDEWVQREHMEEAARRIPNAQLVLIPRASHFAPWQAPKAFNDAVRMVLRDR
jgi:pimeloyl-ACP methyl ester carboxylesterase